MSYISTIIGALLLGITTSPLASMEPMKDIIEADEDDYVLVSFKEEKKAIEKKIQKPPSLRLSGTSESQSYSYDLLQLIKKAREEAWVHVCILKNKPDDFVDDYTATLTHNSLNLDLPIRCYYQTLGISPEDGKRCGHQEIMVRIAFLQEQSTLAADHYTGKGSILRQVAYPFKTSIGKRCYDAFLEGKLKELVVSYQAKNLHKVDAYEAALTDLMQHQSHLS